KKVRVDQNGGFNVKNEYEVALRREQELEKSFQRAADEQARLDQASVRLGELEHEFEDNKTLYDNFFQRFKETKGNMSLEHAETRVITPAEAPSDPSYPRRGVFFFAAASLSLIAGAALSLILEARKNGFSTVEEVESHLQFPVVATIRNLTDRDLKYRGKVLSL